MNNTKKFLCLIASIIIFNFYEVSFADTGDNLSYLISSDQYWKVEKLSQELSDDKILYLPEINLLSFQNISDLDRDIVKKYFNVDEGCNLPEIYPDTISGEIPCPIEKLKVDYNLSTNLLSNDYSPFNWSYKRVLSENDPHNNKYGEGVKIGVIDSGIDCTHPGLKESIISERNYINDNQEDELGHGTQVAGVIHTLAPNASMISYKVMDANEGESYDVISAIIDAVYDGVDVINISLGSYKDLSKEDERFLVLVFKKVIDFAQQNHVVIVASAGNESRDLDDISENSIHVPGGLSSVITVAATKKMKKRLSIQILDQI